MPYGFTTVDGTAAVSVGILSQDLVWIHVSPYVAELFNAHLSGAHGARVKAPGVRGARAAHGGARSEVRRQVPVIGPRLRIRLSELGGNPYRGVGAG